MRVYVFFSKLQIAKTTTTTTYNNNIQLQIDRVLKYLHYGKIDTFPILRKIH